MTIGDMNDPIELKLVAKDTQNASRVHKMLRKRKQPKGTKSTLAEEFWEYRDAVFSPFQTEITPTLNTMTHKASSYKDMVEFTTGDGVRKAKIDYYTQELWTFKVSRKKTGGDDQDLWRLYCIIQIATPDSQNREYKTYTWKKVG